MKHLIRYYNCISNQRHHKAPSKRSAESSIYIELKVGPSILPEKVAISLLDRTDIWVVPAYLFGTETSSKLSCGDTPRIIHQRNYYQN